MNSTEQRERHTQIGELNQKIDALTEALDIELTEHMTDISEIVRDERTHRLKMCGETQSCVDGLAQSVMVIDRHIGSLVHELATITTLTLWGRIRWLLTGRFTERVNK